MYSFSKLLPDFTVNRWHRHVLENSCRLIMASKCFIVVLLAAGVGWPRLHMAAQQPTFRGVTDVVELDVVVTDNEHRPVRGLAAADFTVLEHGRPQPIVAFSAIELSDIIAPSARWMRTIGSDVTSNTLDTRRIVVIVIDDPTMPFSPGVTKLARLVGHGIVDRLGPTDLAAVVYTYRGRNQNFTTDKAALKAAVDVLIPHPRALACAIKSAGCDIETLIGVADVLNSAPPGRKLIMLISAGRNFVDFDQLGGLTDDRAFYLREMLEKLQRANVAIYAFDPNGLQTGAVSAEDARPGVFHPDNIGRLNETLRMFAEGTGGRAITDVNTPWEDVPGVFAENDSYYLLGFRPEDPREDGRYRKVQVKVNRPGLEVHARGGYFVPKPAKPAKPGDAPPSPLEETMARGLPSGEIPLQVTVAPFAGRGTREPDVLATISVRVPVEAAKPTAPVTPMALPLDVAVTAYDLDWKPKGTSKQHAELTVRPGSERAFSSPAEITARLPLPPGRYELRIGAESPPNTGGVFVDIDVPKFDKDPVSLSGVVIERGASRPTTTNDVVPVAPTVERTFERTDRVRAFARIYQGGSGKLAPVSLKTTIIDARDQTVVIERATLTQDRFTSRAADYLFELPLARLAPGEHVLTIEAAIGKRTVRRDVRFVRR